MCEGCGRWRSVYTAEPKLMNLSGYKGELKAMQCTPRYLIMCQNHRVGISLCVGNEEEDKRTCNFFHLIEQIAVLSL